ncbi:hypothetical protein DAPPUDRAFT_333027 [Daphnia pulex]|uniref:AB hydrolase-1 domain-containing protein n=1 Tax=Daphnia pulex TaxID=6669 RepID=E9HRM4_DAPPU|nr:hypothetical protein DAPPUDRAFT_333027 [Daphnia pulex]|eukprot:EFX65609.1 hypothetical protein DAPPUDRAFT_333027 [Daphnia pulex]
MSMGITSEYDVNYVNIGRCVEDNADNLIWTLTANKHGKGTPVVLIHGFLSALGLWVLNLDELAQNRPVYAIDLLGCGSSGRPTFSSDAVEAERKMVKSIEAWVTKVLGSKASVLVGQRAKTIAKGSEYLSQKFSGAVEEAHENISQYLYCCNEQSPTWEVVSMCQTPHREPPSSTRARNSDNFHLRSELVDFQFLNKEVFIQVIGGAGHHVYADKVNKFNELVLGACMETDNRKSAAATARVGHRSPPNASAL